MLTDENDCSIRESGQFYFAAQQKTTNGSPFHLPKARAVCDTGSEQRVLLLLRPEGPQGRQGRQPDLRGRPVLQDGRRQDGLPRRDDRQHQPPLLEPEAPLRHRLPLRDGSLPEGAHQQTVTDRIGTVVANPIFSDLDPSDANTNIRTSGLIFLAGIVGVPWQDIARTDANGVPDLKTGIDPKGAPRGGFKSASEMAEILPGKDYTTWDVILGDRNTPRPRPSPRIRS
jgi:hypothetical protein